MKPIFQAIAAKVGPKGDIPCCEWVGPRGAGHYVKMVHNGIEYGDMQLICEAYWMLKQALGLSNDALYDVFSQWYQGDLNSYLIEITGTSSASKRRPCHLVDRSDAASQGPASGLRFSPGHGRAQHLVTGPSTRSLCQKNARAQQYKRLNRQCRTRGVSGAGDRPCMPRSAATQAMQMQAAAAELVAGGPIASCGAWLSRRVSGRIRKR